MNEERFENKLKAFEPAVDSELPANVLRDAGAVMDAKPFNARVHCTKKSRFRAVIAGMTGGICAGVLGGVIVMGGMFAGSSPSNTISNTPSPDERAVKSVEPESKPSLPGNGRNGYAVMARNAMPTGWEDVDRMIEIAENRAKQFQWSENRGGEYVNRQYVSPNAIDFNENMLLYQRQMAGL